MSNQDHTGLRLTGVAAGYGRKTIVRDIVLPTLPTGSTTVLLGPNGAGKSTLLRALAGFGTLDGAVSLDSRDVQAMTSAERRATFGYLPQALPPAVGLTVLEAAIGALRAAPPPHLHQSSITEMTHEAFSALDQVGIVSLANKNLSELSGGQRQLAGLAQIMARRPRVLLLDEPTSALDLRYQTRVMRQVINLVAEHGLIAIIVMHDIALAARYADRIAVLSDGTLYGSGTPADMVTAGMLRDVYGVRARVEACSLGYPQVIVDDML